MKNFFGAIKKLFYEEENLKQSMAEQIQLVVANLHKQVAIVKSEHETKEQKLREEHTKEQGLLFTRMQQELDALKQKDKEKEEIRLKKEQRDKVEKDKKIEITKVEKVREESPKKKKAIKCKKFSYR